MSYPRRRYDSHIKKNTTFGLNITSMTDMFTILLVFLLQTYSTSEVQVIPENGIKLPTAYAEQNPAEAVQLSLSTTELKLGKQVLAQLQNGDFITTDVDRNDTNFLPKLFSELQKLAPIAAAAVAAPKPAQTDATKMEDSRADHDKAVNDGKVLLQADESLNYQVLRKVMYTASMAGFPKLKLATVVGQ